MKWHEACSLIHSTIEAKKKNKKKTKLYFTFNFKSILYVRLLDTRMVCLQNDLPVELLCCTNI
jgi:hypothetical protein